MRLKSGSRYACISIVILWLASVAALSQEPGSPIYNLQPVEVPFQNAAPSAPAAEAESDRPSSGTFTILQGPRDSTPAVVSPTVPNGVAGTGESDVDAPTRLDLATVEERRQQVDAAELPEEVKAAALTHYQQAAELLRRADDAQRKAGELRTEKDNGPQIIAEITAQLAQALGPHEPEIPDEAGVAELEPRRLADEEALVAARKALEDWEQRAQVRAERKPQMPDLIDRTRQTLAEARTSLAAPAPGGEAPAVSLARRTEQEAYVVLLEQQVELYQVEKARYDALSGLFPLRRDLYVRNLNFLERRCEAWKASLLIAARREAARQAAEARRRLQEAHPALRDLAERNAELTQLRSGLQDLLATTRSRLAAIGETLTELESDFQRVQDKESRAGLTTAIGMLLRNQRNHLPDEAAYRSHQHHAVSEISRLQIERMPLEDERDELGDTAVRAEEIVAEIGPVDGASAPEIADMTLTLLNDRKKYLNDLLNDYDACIDELAELDVRSRKLIDTTGEYRNYIDERVLWIRSAGLVGLETPQRALSGLADLATPVRWTQIFDALYRDTVRSPVLTGLLFCGLVFLLALRSRLRAWTRKLGEGGGKKVVGTLSTIAALLLTLGTASVWPLLLWFVGERLTDGTAGEFGVAVGRSLRTTALLFWSIEVFRQICSSGGIAARHLNWPKPALRSLHSNLLTLMIFGLPVVFGVCLADHWQEGMWSDSLGRILFVGGMLLLSLLVRRIMHPEGRVLSEYLNRHQDGWLYRSRRAWYRGAVAVPLVLAGMAVAGFQFTAEQLLIRVEATTWLLIVLLIAFSLTMRWLIAVRKRMATEQARARYAAAIAAAEIKSEASDSPLPKFEEPQVDVSLLSAQMFKLVRAVACVLFLTGGWFIWGEVLPALQVFHRVELWNTTVQVAEQVELAEGQMETRLVTKPQAITLGHVLLASSIVLVFLVAGRNLPGLLELAVLQRLPLDHGGRNAITTLCRYVLSTGGVILAARMVGIGWSSVQWLVAALTVGLGFGLQEIFANFVSGLIILFERPVRIGDVVTIDGVSGTISRIQIRATTVTDFDRKEYLVPNREFVTGRVLNWTLSDKTNRIVITVGVAYGSNTELARGLLVKVATEHPVVLDDPAPAATFEGFGDSCLTLLLRCYLPNLDNRLKTITELHEAIDREFKAHGLEIAFPQRDIHVRTITTLPIPASAPVSEPTGEQKAA